MASQLGSLTALVVIPACAVLESALRHSHRSIRAQRLGVAADGQNCY
jgi:chloramphenicol 3-O-phosphotransferase